MLPQTQRRVQQRLQAAPLVPARTCSGAPRLGLPTAAAGAFSAEAEPIRPRQVAEAYLEAVRVLMFVIIDKLTIFGSNAPKPATGGGLFGNVNTTGTSTGGTGGGIFGNTSGNAAAPASGGLFGIANNTATTPAVGGGLFGNIGATNQTPGAGNASGGGATPAAPLKPPPSNFFAQPAASGTLSTTPAVAPTGGLFGSVPKPADATTSSAASVTTSTPAPAGGGLLGGGLFGAKPSTPAPSSTTASTAGDKDKDASKNTTSSVPNFFAKPDDKKDAPAAPTTLPGFNLLGAAKDSNKDAASAERKDAAPVPSTAFSLGVSTVPKEGDKAAPGMYTAFCLPKLTVTIISVPPPSMLRGKTIEEIVNKWSADLDIHVREFNKFASEVAVWDRALVENGNNLAALFNFVAAAEQEQNDIDQSLDHIEQQQKELISTLEAYERSTEEILGGQSSNLRALDTGPADTERDKNYTLATELHGHLDDLSGSLTQMIDAVNTLALPADGVSQNNEDALSQIGEILSSHLMSLLWIDGSVKEVESRVNEVEKRVRLAEESGASSGFKGRGSFGASGSR
ncbi:Nsp1-like C-terminal region-domain-containing protein [Fomitopsis serialis]|uniref:Nsp1-like C-terminal region-domain-containing protein n=1 Tax=Fomitopsis serialis TaxID=139415 RepID=UPI0020075589|nr:Nsp1-like C-terminal region-domain-containing protein [Neoantrodia serialis]KAH9938541.1 Nsp1-like C-terminal region-domain-containing protein [Neoantrodia serialis]